MKQQDSNRRQFLKKAGMGAGAVAVGSLLSGTNAEAAETERFDRTADVVVAGFGAAGAAAAIEATAAGAKVLLLEKNARGGGATWLSGGIFACPDSAQDGANYLRNVAYPADSKEGYEIDEAHMLEYGTEAAKNIEWLKSLGAPGVIRAFQGWYHVPGQGGYYTYIFNDGKAGVGVFGCVEKAVKDRKIETLYETPVVELITRHGAVVGVIAEAKGKKIRIAAKKGVILTTGGFDANRNMVRNYLMPNLQTVAPAFNQGDAIKLVAKVGAALWHLNSASIITAHYCGRPEYAISKFALSPPTSQVNVNKYANRFMDESTHSYDQVSRLAMYYDVQKHEYPNLPYWTVFDEKARLNGPFAYPVPMGTSPDGYTWSQDNSAEIAQGWVLKADTIRELAAAMKVDADSLEKTITRFNEFCAKEKDEDFGRDMGLNALENAPYYALRAYPSTFATNGGPRITVKGQVIDVHGNIIPGLYACGAASSFVSPFVYGVSGTSIGECFAIGRLAGRTAAATKA